MSHHLLDERPKSIVYALFALVITGTIAFSYTSDLYKLIRYGVTTYGEVDSTHMYIGEEQGCSDDKYGRKRRCGSIFLKVPEKQNRIEVSVIGYYKKGRRLKLTYVPRQPYINSLHTFDFYGNITFFLIASSMGFAGSCWWVFKLAIKEVEGG